MLLVVVAVTLALCAQSGSLPYLQDKRPFESLKNLKFNFQGSHNSGGDNAGSVTNQNPPPASSYIPDENNQGENVEWLLTSNKTVQVSNPPPGLSYEVQYPSNLTSGFYTVQVFSGYNSQSAYNLRNALRYDGYRAYIFQETTDQGILFKVRVGKYRNRSDAFAMNTKLRLHYPKTLSGNFVLMRR
ncbi:MAG: hypothetical protein CSA79_06140 [Thiothrix nivea]|nr:MAG: hypothetical protein CSA79_06140 [Thiothrix nivea]